MENLASTSVTRKNKFRIIPVKTKEQAVKTGVPLTEWSKIAVFAKTKIGVSTAVHELPERPSFGNVGEAGEVPLESAGSFGNEYPFVKKLLRGA